MQLVFGIGALWGTRNDVAGVGPDQFGVLQDNSIDFAFELKELYSQLQFPVDIARGKGKITGKAKMARVFGALYADLFFGASALSAGQQNVSQSELKTLATVSVSVTNASTFVADLGVYYNAAGNKPLTFVTGAPGLGQYSTGTNGAYTFNVGDVGAVVAISYVWTDTLGKIVSLTNNFMGYTPTFVGTFYQNRATQGGSGQMTLRLNECVSNHLTIPARLDDYAIQDFDFSAFATGANIIGTISTSE
jgi:hypothetical protein